MKCVSNSIINLKRYNRKTMFPHKFPSFLLISLLTLSTLGFFIPKASAADTTFEIFPTQYAILNGTYVSGNLASFRDGTNMNPLVVDEMAQSPGWDIEYNFTIPQTTANFIYNFLDNYTGNLDHTINADVYNFTSASWQTVQQYHDEGVYTWHNITISNTAGIIQNGTVMCRLYHVSQGNMNHIEQVDYAQLLISTPSNGFWLYVLLTGIIVFPAGVFVMLNKKRHR